MARAIIAIGSAGNDGTGDTLRAGAIKINNNFAEVYQDLASIGLLVNDSVGGLNLDGISFDQRSVVFIGTDSPNSTPADNNETYLRAVEPTKDNIIILPDSSGNVALTADIPTNVSALTNDAGYVTAAAAGIDSAAALTLINDNSIDSIGTINLIDATYIQARQSPSGLDSTHTGYFINAYVTKNYLVSRNLVLDSAAVNEMIDSRVGGTFLDSAGFNSLAQALEVSLIPAIDNSHNLGSNTKRFNNAFIKTSLEIDSARFSYDSALDLVNIQNVGTIRLENGVDSGFLAVDTLGGKSVIQFGSSLLPNTDSSLDLGSSSFKWRDLYLSGNTINLGSAKISAVGSAIRSSLPIYDSIGVVPSGGTAGDLIIIANADSATGGPSIAFKDSNNGNYITYNTAGTPSGGGGGGF